MRLDRFITLSVARPLRSALVRAAVAKPTLPVLMYHSISIRDESHLRDYFKVCTAPERFRLQMQTLRDHGYAGVDLESGLDWLKSGPTTSARMVAITFDDGFRDFYTEAVPVLAEHGFTATMYLPTTFIRERRQAFKELECMTWSEVLESQSRGMRFGSHTVHHPKLYELPWPEIEAELRESRAELEDQLGQPAHSFAYPYAFPEADRDFCGRLRDTLIRGGYRSCVTTIAGRVATGDDAYTLRRLPMNGADDSALLLAKLGGAYDWMEPAQRSFKRFKRLVSRRSRRTEAGHSIGNP